MSSRKVFMMELNNHPTGKKTRTVSRMILSPSCRTVGLIAEVNGHGISDVRLVFECDASDESPEVLIEFEIVQNGSLVGEDLVYVGSYFCHTRDENSHTITYCHVYERTTRNVYERAARP